MSGFIDDRALAELARMQARAIAVLGPECFKRFLASGRRRSAVVALGDPLWILVGPESEWGLGREVIQASPAEIGEALRHGLPPGWRLLKGKAAREFLASAIRDEERRWKAGRN
jgi:hypothetical protein